MTNLVMWVVTGLLVAGALLLVLLAGTSHADGPAIILSPDGGVTYVYPGTPATVIHPNGGVSYVYTSPSVAAPIVVPVPVLALPNPVQVK